MNSDIKFSQRSVIMNIIEFRGYLLILIDACDLNKILFTGYSKNWLFVKGQTVIKFVYIIDCENCFRDYNFLNFILKMLDTVFYDSKLNGTREWGFIVFWPLVYFKVVSSNNNLIYMLTKITILYEIWVSSVLNSCLGIFHIVHNSLCIKIFVSTSQYLHASLNSYYPLILLIN